MSESMSSRYVYAGVTRWGGGGSRTARPDTLGGVFRMKIGEYKWHHLMRGMPEVVHAHCIAAHPEDPAVILVGTHDGPYRSTDRGESWHRTDFEPRDLQVWSIAFHPGNPRIAFAGTSPVGIYRSEDGGESWAPVANSDAGNRLDVGPFINRVMRIAIDPVHTNEIYAAMEVNGVMRSVDGGDTWHDCNDSLMQFGEGEPYRSRVLTNDDREGMLDAHAICTTAAKPRSPIVALRMGLFVGNDRGEAWEDMQVGRFSPLTYARDIRVAPYDPRTLYACLSDSSHGKTGSLYRSGDAGSTWRRFDHSVTPDSPAMAVALDAGNPDAVFFTSRTGQVFGTVDGGKSWGEHLLPSGCKGAYSLLCA